MRCAKLQFDAVSGEPHASPTARDGSSAALPAKLLLRGACDARRFADDRSRFGGSSALTSILSQNHARACPGAFARPDMGFNRFFVAWQQYCGNLESSLRAAVDKEKPGHAKRKASKKIQKTLERPSSEHLRKFCRFLKGLAFFSSAKFKQIMNEISTSGVVRSQQK